MPARKKIASLSRDVIYDLLTAVAALADRMWEFAAVTQQAGWDVIFPRVDFDTSFCQTEEEFAEYRQVSIELAKIRIATANRRLRIEAGQRVYMSDYLETVRKQRESEERGLFDATNRPVWAMEAARCMRRKELWRLEHRDEFDARENERRVEENRRRRREVENHDCVMARDLEASVDQLPDFYAAILKRYAGPLGFSIDERRSQSDGPLFSKSLTESWDLCLSADRLVWWPGRRSGEGRTLLSLRAVGETKPLSAARTESALLIEYSELIPYFDHLYWQFTALDELEAIVKARMFLLAINLGEIERVLRQAVAPAE